MDILKNAFDSNNIIELNGGKVVIVKVYSSYTPSQRRANDKWRQKNPEKVNEYARKYYKPSSILSEEERKKRNEKCKAYYEKNKDKIVERRKLKHLECEN